MRKHIHQLMLAVTAMALLYSCTKSDPGSGGTKKNPTYDIKMNGNVNDQIKFEGACTQVYAMYYPLDASYPNERSLNIQGSDGTKIFGFLLYWQGTFPANPQFNCDVNAAPADQFAVGQYIPDASNSSTAYSTADGGTGICTITNYDQTTQTISGTFQFNAKLTVNGSPTGPSANFSGSFTDIPINDLTDPNNPKGPCFGSTGATLGGGTGGGGGGGSTTTITFVNPTYTTMDISFNGQTKTAAAGSSAVFSGTANSSATGTATTSGKTTSGTQVGSLLTWNISQAFPASGNLNYTLNAGPDYFFLKMKNQSSLGIQKVYVNYGLVNQTVDNISVPNNGTVYNLGYYKAFSNSNVRAENGNNYWLWSTLSLPYINNQSITVTAN